MRNKVHIITIATIGLMWLMLLQGVCLGANEWRAVITRTQDEYDAGTIPGETMQFPHSMVRSYSNPDYVYWAHDCGQGWRSKDGGDTWERFLAKGLGSVYGQSIEVDPTNPDTVFITIDNLWDTASSKLQGIYKSTDSGDNWTLVQYVDWTEDNRWYKHNIAYSLDSISGGEAKIWYAAFAGKGLYRSTDGGNNWNITAANLATHAPIYALYVHPTDSNLIYLGSDEGLYISTDGGSTLNSLGDLPPGHVTTIQINLTNPDVIYVAVKDSGAYKSTNGGTNFSSLKLANNTVGCHVNLGSPNIVYFLYKSGIEVSQNGGSSWSSLVYHPRDGLGREDSWGNTMIPWDGLGAIIPNPSNIAEAVGYGQAALFKTTNYIDWYHSIGGFSGYAWTVRDSVVFDPCNPDRFGIFAADKGLFISEDAGQSFVLLKTPVSNILSGVWGYSGNSNDMKAGAFQPGSDRFVGSGGQIWGLGNMGIAYSEGNSGPWQTTDAPYGPTNGQSYRNFFYNPVDPNILFVYNQKSNDGGVSFNNVDYLVANSLEVYKMCKSNPEIIYATNQIGNSIYRSTDGGENWDLYVSKVSYGYPSGAVAAYNNIVFDVDPEDANIIYTLYYGDLAVYDGSSWQSLGLLNYIRTLDDNTTLVSLQSNAIYPGISTVIVDPNDNSIIYASVAHAGVSSIYRSTDRGNTWEDISYNLPRANYANALSMNPHTGEIFVGSGSGTWVFPPPYNQNTPIYTNSVIVNAANSNQTLVLNAIGNKSVSENSLLSFTVTATDADSDTITYSATGLPTGATFASQSFSWTPGYTQSGTYQVTFAASDGQAQDSETITITVSNLNQAPVLATVGDKSVNENSSLSFSVSATDADGDTITYSVQSLPSGAVFGNQTFTWTPGYTQVGTHQVTFTASDGTASDFETITITVNNTNQPPVLGSVGNKSVYTENSLTFTVSATDADSDTITYSATGLPSGATFSGQNFSWTPGSSQAGSYDVTFTASDSQTQDSETITITVTADTSAPTVTNLSPAADSIQAPLNSLIYLDVTDSGKGVNTSTVTIEVNSNLVYTGNTTYYSSSYGHCRRIGTSAAYTYVYQADEMFDYDQTVTVTVNAADLAANSMDEYSYSFKTEMRSFGENRKANSSSNNLNDSSPATASDSSGNIWAVWHTGQTGSRDIYAGKLTAGADSFGDSAQVTNDNADQCNPAIAIDSADKLYVVWQDNRNGEWDIYVSTSTDGTNFSSERKVTDPNSDQINPAAVIDSSDKAYIVWEDDRNNNKDIYIASSSNSFVSYATSQITSNASDQITPAVAVDSGNTVYVVWMDARSGTNDIYGADSTNGPWTNVAVVSNANNQSSPAIAAEASGTILHLLWVDNTSGNNDIYYASSNGLPGSPLNGSSIIDDDSGADQSAPVITTTGSTGNDLKVFACWKDGRNISSGNGDTDIYFVEANSGSGTNVLVGDDGTNSAQSYPAMGIDGYGYPHLAWTDDRNTATNIYYAGSTFVESATLESEDLVASSGATVGTELASINSATDVSVTIPAEACSHDATITISRIKNPPKLTLDNLGTLYEFGPSGIEFDHPVTIIIPYDLSTVGNSPSAYWYNPLTSVLSQQGITDIETVEISSTLHALHFKTTHFTQFLVGGDIAAAAGEGGGGWGLSCSMSPNSQGSIVEFLLPYIGLTVVMTILKLQDKHKKKMRDIAKSEC